jgi:hypothetical protein
MVKTSQNRNSVKIVLDFTGFFRLLGNNSVIPFLTAAEKRHFHPPKLPALRAEVVSPAQKSARVFSCFLAAASKISRFCPFRRVPAFAASGFSCGHLVLFRCFLPTLPYSGATSGFQASGGDTLDCVMKAAQTADTGATGVTGVSAVRSTCVFNKIGIFPLCHVLIQLLHLPVVVLLKRRLNRSDCEQQVAIAFAAILRRNHRRFCDEQTAFFERPDVFVDRVRTQPNCITDFPIARPALESLPIFAEQKVYCE